MRTNSERVWLSAIILLVSAGVASAQQVAVEASTGGALDEIIVTAQRRAQSIMDVPIAITAIAGDTLAKQGINNSADLA